MLQKFKDFAKTKKNGFCEYEWTDQIIKRGNQTFACFGGIAFDVTKLKFDDEMPGTGRLCTEIKGKYFAEFPDEGDCGIMGLYIVNVRGKKLISSPCFVCCGWIYTRELELSNDEIKENIIEDINNGKNVLSKAPAGWL